MAEDICKRIDEIAALYANEPELHDIYVEGSSDYSLLNWYFKNRCDKRVSIYEIDVIEVTPQLLEKHELDNGNRSRVLALAFELTELLKETPQDYFTVVYDKDFDVLEATPIKPKNAICTDYSCLEMYLFNADTINKFTSIGLRIKDFDAVQTIDSLAAVLVRLWVIKAANHILGYGMRWISFTKNCSLNGLKILFDEEEFVNKYLLSNGRMGDAIEFREKIEEINKKVDPDHRNNINGHHFFDLALWYFRKISNNRAVLHNLDSFEPAISGCVELSNLDQYQLFKALLNRVSNSR